MDKRTKISFIPQKPLLKKERPRVSSINLLLLLSAVVFFTTLSVYAGLYFYKLSLVKTLDEKKEELALEKEKVDPEDIIKESRELQTRIRNARRLVDEHVIFSPVFGFIEEVTLKSVAFDGLSFSKEAQGEDTRAATQVFQDTSGTGKYNLVVEMNGQAPNYASLAYQSDVLKEELSKGDRIKEFSISNINLDMVGNVLFSLRLSFNSHFLSYKEIFNNETDQSITEDDNSGGQTEIGEGDVFGTDEPPKDSEVVDDLVSLF